MAETANMRQGPRPRVADPDPAEVQRCTERRDNARWTAVVGFAMMFAAGFSAAFAVGGMLMLVYGIVVSIYWSRRIVKLKGDPWAYDPDLDGPRQDDHEHDL